MTKKQAGTAPVQAAALPKTSKSVTNIDVLHLKSVLEVCAFASEAKRILEGIDYAAEAFPKVKRGIRTCVAASGNWTTLEAPIAEVLASVASELGRLADDIDRMEVGNEF